MRVFHPDKKLIRVLASEIKEKNKPIRIVAQEQNTALDEATESAKAYWMMGWTWEEIDSILEDSGFSAKAIASAIKAAQKYAYECLKDGPFKNLKEGQLVQLKNGFVGKLVNKYAEHISVKGKEDKIEVDSANINFETSAKLQKAHALRESAKKIMRKAQEKIDVPGEGEYPTELKKEPDIRELAPRTTVTPQMEIPKEKGITEALPEKWLDVPEATVTIQGYADDLSMYQEMINEIEAERKKAYAAYKEKFLGPKKEVEREQQEVGQKLAAIMETQRQAMNVLETVFINRTGNLLVGFVSELSEHKQPAGFVDKYNALVKFLQENFPEAAQKSLDMIERWDEENKAVWQELTTEVFVSKPSEKFIKGKQAQGWWSKMKDWVSNLWDSVKQKVNDFYTNTVPNIEEMNDTLESMLADMQLQEKAAKINKALKIHIK